MTKITNITVLTLLWVLTCCAQVVLPEGTKIRVRLERNISSATAERGQTVEFSVTDVVRVDDAVAIAEGARVTGVITLAHERGRLGRAGKLDFSIDRVRTVDNQWVPLRYTVTRTAGQSHIVRAGILLWKGQDVNLNRGTAFEVFTDTNHANGAPTAGAGISPGPVAPPPPSVPVPESAIATISVTSSIAAAEIEVDGAFVGNAPTTLQLAAGTHRIVVKRGAKSWQRTLQVTGGSTISLNASLQ